MTKPGDLPPTNWEEKYEKEHKLRQEVEGELSIVKTITIDASPEMRDAKAKIKELKETLQVREDTLSDVLNENEKLKNNLDRTKKENNDLYNKIADLTEVAKSKDYFRDPDYKFLIEENRKLEEERNELLTDNKKLSGQIEDKLTQMRRSGM